MHEESMPPAFYEANALNRMLSCFDKAEAAAGTDAALQKNLRRERDLMMADYRAAVTLKTPGLKGADRELAMKLFRDYAGEQRAKYEDLSKALSQEGLAAGKKEALQKERDTLTAALRQALNRFGCMGVPQDTDLLPALELFVKDPEAARAKYPVKTVKTDAEKIPGGIRLPATAFAGGFGPDLYGWFCPPKTGMAIYAPRSPRPSQMKTEFTLDAAPAGAAVLDIEGQDSQNDLPPPAQIEITLNGKKIHAGDCGFVKRGWSRRQFPIPAGALQKGKNVLEIRNITPETKRLDGWWFFLSEAAIKFEK
jgi:hypothetical protein